MSQALFETRKGSQLALLASVSSDAMIPVILDDGEIARTPIAALLETVPELALLARSRFKGDPGGVLNAIGTFSDAVSGLLAIPGGVTMVRTTGNVQDGVGSGWYGQVGSYTEAKVNLLASPGDFTGAGWTLNSGATLAADIDGYTLIGDPSVTLYSYLAQTIARPVDGKATVEVVIRKDAVPAATRTVLLRGIASNNAARFSVQLDTSTGACSYLSGENYNVPDDFGVIDQGASWLAWVSFTMPATDTISWRLYPAFSGAIAESDFAKTGSVAIKSPQAYAGTVRASVFDAANAGISFPAADGRRFRLSLDQEITPFQFAVLDSAADNAPALNRFFAFTTANRCRRVDISCSGTILSTVNWSGGLSYSFKGTMRLTAAGPMTWMMIQTGLDRRALRSVKIELFGTGGQDYSTRTVFGGVLVNSCGRMRFGIYEGANFKYALVHSPSLTSGNNNNYADFGLVKAQYAGSGSIAKSITESLTANWTAAAGATSGTVDSFSQGTTISVDAIPELAITGIGVDMQVRLHPQNRPYGVKSITRAAGNDGSGVGPGTITVFEPFDATATASGTLEWLFGGGFSNSGPNSNGQTAEIETTQCGRALALDSLFGGKFKVSGQFCGTLVAAGQRLSGAHDTTSVEFGYTEGNTERVVIANSWQGAAGHIHFRNMVGSQDDGSATDWTFAPVHSFTTFQPSDGKAGMKGSILPYNGRAIAYQKNNPAAYRKVSDALQIDPNDNQLWYAETGLDTRTVNVVALNPSLRRNLGVSGIRYVLQGTGPNGAPTGTITWTASDGLASGASSQVFSGFDGPAVFSAEYDQATGGFLVRLIAGKGASATPTAYAVPALAAGALDTIQTVTVAGLLANDFVDHSFSGDPGALRLEVWAKSAGVAAFRWSNPTAAASTSISGTVYLRPRRM